MVVVTVELKSAISPTRDKQFGVLHISNSGLRSPFIGTNQNERFSYNVTLLVNGRETATGRVLDFNRNRPVWDLVRAAMKAVKL
jgi:hypothetical protein